MQWRTPVKGQQRIIKRFLFLPTTINGETRWLMTAQIIQKYHTGYDDFWETIGWF